MLWRCYGDATVRFAAAKPKPGVKLQCPSVMANRHIAKPVKYGDKVRVAVARREGGTDVQSSLGC